MKRYELLVLAFLGIAMAFILDSFCGSKALAQEKVKVGGIMDLTGPTNSLSANVNEGIANYIDKVNKEGGINGRRIDYYAIDYQYKIPLAMAAYKRLVADEKVICILGFGTGDSKARIPLANSDKITQLFTGLSEDLTDPLTPYCFSGLVSYMHQVAGMLKYAKEHPVGQGRKVRVAYVYSDAEYGRSVFRNIKKRMYAEKIGVEVVDEEVISEIATETVSQALNLKKANPDYTIIVLTSRPASIFIKDSKNAGVETKFMGFSPLMSMDFIKLTGELSKGLTVVLPYAQWQEMNVPGIKKMWEYNKKYYPTRKFLDPNYITGWAHTMILGGAIKKAGDNLTGEGIKNALETLTDFETDGITPPITFSDKDHRGTYSFKLGLGNPQRGTFEPFTDWIKGEK